MKNMFWAFLSWKKKYAERGRSRTSLVFFTFVSYSLVRNVVSARIQRRWWNNTREQLLWSFKAYLIIASALSLRTRTSAILFFLWSARSRSIFYTHTKTHTQTRTGNTVWVENMQVVSNASTFYGNALRSTHSRRRQKAHLTTTTKAYVDWTLGEPARVVKSACSPSSEQYEPEDAISVNEIIEKNDGIFIPFKESKEVVLKFTLEDAKTKEVTKLAKTCCDLRVQAVEGVFFLYDAEENAKPVKCSGKAIRTLRPGSVLSFCHHGRERRLELFRNAIAHAWNAHAKLKTKN